MRDFSALRNPAAPFRLQQSFFFFHSSIVAVTLLLGSSSAACPIVIISHETRGSFYACSNISDVLSDADEFERNNL